MKKRLLLFLFTLLMAITIAGCGNKTELDPSQPVTLTIWHVYGEQAESPMNRLIEEFNNTVGKEKGIIINTTLMSNASQIGPKLLDSQAGKPGSLDMPDLFFCHNSNVSELGVDNVIDWNDCFTSDEIQNFLPDFLADGMVDDSLAVLPVSKSTQLLFVNGNEFERFSKASGVKYENLSTWEGFFDAAGKYYEWSGGKSFCAFDYLLRSVELNAISGGASSEDFYKDGWYDFTDSALKDSWLAFAESLVQGHIVISDLYSNTQVMTGDVACGLGSSASILYYNDMVTYPDNTTEPMNLHILPMPKAGGGQALASQAGVGLCAWKTTSQKEEAASVFAHWLTESERNLDFAAETGYMPVTYAAYEGIADYSFDNPAYETLYKTYADVQQNCTMLREPAFPGYFTKATAFYAELKASQGDFEARCRSGESASKLAKRTWKMFQNVK